MVQNPSGRNSSSRPIEELLNGRASTSEGVDCFSACLARRFLGGTRCLAKPKEGKETFFMSSPMASYGGRS